MDITSNEVREKLHYKLNDGVNTLMMTKKHLESFKKDFEATVMIQLKSAKAALKAKKQKATNAMEKSEKLMAAKKDETAEAVAEWKMKHDHQKLEKRAERAEEYADACTTLAMYYAAEAELAILEAISARQDSNSK